MKALKNLLTLVVAMAVSVTSFAETSKTLSEDNATKQREATKKTVASPKTSSTKETLKSKTDSVKKTSTKISSTEVEEGLKNKKDSVKASVTKKTTTARETLNSAKTSAKEKEEAAVSNKITAVKNASKVNINTATAEQLQSLTGIGEVRAKAIMEYRKKVGKIKNAAELSNIPGIGDAISAKIAPYLTF